LDLKLLNCLSETKAYFYVRCSSGSYVRRLAEDIAKTLGTFATVTALRRVGFRDFNKKLISLDYLLTLVHSDDLKHILKPINLVFDNVNEIILDENGAQHILNGRTVKIKTVVKSHEKEFTLAKFKNEVIAIGYLKNDSFYPKKLLSYL
jgi:tRNA pseudouridine55 synthase